VCRRPPTEPYNTLRLAYSSSLDIAHRQQLQHRMMQASSPGGGPLHHSRGSSSSSSSVAMAAGQPWLGLAGLQNLLQPGGVHEEARVRMTHAASQLAELTSQLVSSDGCCVCRRV
jgi:hypothetical protein